MQSSRIIYLKELINGYIVILSKGIDSVALDIERYYSLCITQYIDTLIRKLYLYDLSNELSRLSFSMKDKKKN